MKSGKIRHWQKKQVNISSTYWTAHKQINGFCSNFTVKNDLNWTERLKNDQRVTWTCFACTLGYFIKCWSES